MKVLLLNPPFTDYGGLEGHGGKALPLNLAYLAAYLRVKRPEIEIKVLDCEGLGLSYFQIEEEIKTIRPAIVGLTAPTPAFAQVLEVCRIIKNISRDIVVVVGGPHPTALPKETVAEKDLDALPFPARVLFPLDIYFPPPTKRMSDKKAGNMISSRGCPYQCTYCMASYMWQRKVRFRSIKNVVDEIEECINKYGLGEFNFHDELFTVNKKRTIEFCQEVKKRDLDIVWVCMCRVDYLDEETLREMKSAGCRKIMFGFESGSQMILDIMKKRVALDKAEEAVRLVKKAGIKTAGNFMFGNIGETEETIKQSIKLAKKLNCDTMGFFVASPYPGTEFYETAKARGYFRKDIEWKDFTLVSNNLPPLNLPGLPAERILYWQKRAFREYYLRPRYVLMKIAGVNSWVDLKNLYNGAKLFLRIER